MGLLLKFRKHGLTEQCAAEAAEYCIYNGRIYYSAGPEQSESSMKIKSMSLSGNDIRELYAAPANQSWMKIIQMSIYRDRIYFVGRSDSEDASISGSLYSCGLDGSDLKEIAPKATWFNIVDSMLYYRFENYADLEAGRKEPMYRVYIGDLEESEDPGVHFIHSPQLGHESIAQLCFVHIYSPVSWLQSGAHAARARRLNLFV